MQIDIRWGAGDAERFRKYAAELSALAPDVIVASGGVTMQALQQATRSVPLVSALVIDPVGAGYVASLARPGGNVTGFTLFEYGIGAKWLELLKEIAPHVARVEILRDPTATSGTAPALLVGPRHDIGSRVARRRRSKAPGPGMRCAGRRAQRAPPHGGAGSPPLTPVVWLCRRRCLDCLVSRSVAPFGAGIWD
jgi:ABC transporter substrate binding protein